MSNPTNKHQPTPTTIELQENFLSNVFLTKWNRMPRITWWINHPWWNQFKSSPRSNCKEQCIMYMPKRISDVVSRTRIIHLDCFFWLWFSFSTPVATNSGTMKNRHFLGEKNNNVGMKMHCSNGWGDIGLIFSWEAASAGCRAQEPMVGSQPAVFFSK